MLKIENQTKEVVVTDINIFQSLKNKKEDININLSYELKLRLSKCTSKSSMIRLLNKENYSNKSISTILNIRYQFVYNVLNQKVK